MEKYQLSKSQIKKLENHYKVPFLELVVDDHGIINHSGGGHAGAIPKVYKDDELITIPSHLNELINELYNTSFDGCHIKFSTNKNKIFHKEIKALLKLLNHKPYEFQISKGRNILKFLTHMEGDGFGSFLKNAWNKTKAIASDAFNKIATRSAGDIYNKGQTVAQTITPVTNTKHMPDLKTLYQMANASYKPQEEIVSDKWIMVQQDDYLAVYKNNETQTIIVAIRGTDPKDTGDIAADIGIALGTLTSSPRYQRDLQTITNLQKTYKPEEWWYAGVGHSLGGALLDEFIKLGLLKEGVSFNPAVSKADYNSPTTNRRIYLSSDPLYNLMGRFTSNHEVRESNKGPLASHELNNFVGGNKDLKLHAVVIKKPYNFEEARSISQHYIKEPKKQFVRETGTSYRFRKYPKQRFDPNSFITHKENKHTSLIFGKFK